MAGIADFCARWEVSEFCVFGSVLRADFSEGSDIDVLVSFLPAATPSLWTLGAMAAELQEMFGRPVDLLTRNGVSSMQNRLRRDEILRSARRIYAA